MCHHLIFNSWWPHRFSPLRLHCCYSVSALPSLKQQETGSFCWSFTFELICSDFYTFFSLHGVAVCVKFHWFSAISFANRGKIKWKWWRFQIKARKKLLWLSLHAGTCSATLLYLLHYLLGSCTASQKQLAHVFCMSPEKDTAFLKMWRKMFYISSQMHFRSSFWGICIDLWAILQSNMFLFISTCSFFI